MQPIELNNIVTNIMEIERTKKFLHMLREYDEETYKHSINVAYLVSRILPYIPKHITETEGFVENIITGALLHDIGKVTVPKDILRKVEPLTKKEFAYIKMHPLNGIDILGCDNFPLQVMEIVLMHHEKMNGTGYMCGYVAEEIPFSVKIVTVADIYSALSEKRCYKKALSQEEIYKIMDDNVKRSAIDKKAYEALKLSLSKDYQDKI